MIRIRVMEKADLPLGMRLKGEAGWNQTEADWSRYLALQPDGCFVAESEGRGVGTLTTCLFGPVAWIAMVLVTPAMRGRGIGRTLMAHALEFLDGRGVRTARLDATPLGRGLYEGFGFAGEFELARYTGVPRPVEARASVREFDSSRMGDVLDLDRAVTAADRGRLLRRLAEEDPGAIRQAGPPGEVDGYLMGRPGSGAYQIGPCIATGEAGSDLLADALGRLGDRRVLVDIPLENREATSLALATGLTLQRPFLRMTRGERVVEDRGRIWASYGPEMG